MDICRHVPASLLGNSADIFQKDFVNESGMIRSQMGMQNRLENGRSAWDALYDAIP
jgi:hypothetical protein